MPVTVVMVVMSFPSDADINSDASLCIRQWGPKQHSCDCEDYQHGFFHHYSPFKLLLSNENICLIDSALFYLIIQ